MQSCLTERRSICLQALMQGGVPTPELFNEDFIDYASGLDQLYQRLPVTRGQGGEPYSQGRRSKPIRHLLQLHLTGACTTLSLEHSRHEE